MTTVTGQDVYIALMRDLRFSSQPDDLLTILTPFIISMPDYLKDFLDKKVTAPLLWEARIIFIQKYIEGEYFKKYIESLSDEEALFTLLGNKEELAEKGQEKLNNSLSTLTEYFREISEADNRTSDLVFKSIPDLKRKVLEKYKNNDLTFADLLKMQPAIIAYL